MGEDSVDMENTARQISQSLEEASRCLRRAYFSQDGKGKMDGNATREGQRHLSNAERLIGENLPALVDKINPSVVLQSMVASGVTYEVAANVTTAIQIYKAQQAIAAANALAGAEAVSVIAGSSMLATAGMIAGGVVAAVAVTFFFYKFFEWLDSPKEDPAPIVRQYKERYVKPSAGYKPFHMPHRPGVAR